MYPRLNLRLRELTVACLGAHNDYSWFTLVWQITGTPALEVLNRNAEWISAPPLPNALTVNV